MKNSYELAGVAELGRASDVILGLKWVNWESIDSELGLGWVTGILDIDESDEY